MCYSNVPVLWISMQVWVSYEFPFQSEQVMTVSFHSSLSKLWLTTSSSWSSSRFPDCPYVGMSPRVLQNSDVALRTMFPSCRASSGSAFTLESTCSAIYINDWLIVYNSNSYQHTLTHSSMTMKMVVLHSLVRNQIILTSSLRKHLFMTSWSSLS